MNMTIFKSKTFLGKTFLVWWKLTMFPYWMIHQCQKSSGLSGLFYVQKKWGYMLPWVLERNNNLHEEKTTLRKGERNMGEKKETIFDTLPMIGLLWSQGHVFFLYTLRAREGRNFSLVKYWSCIEAHGRHFCSLYWLHADVSTVYIAEVWFGPIMNENAKTRGKLPIVCNYSLLGLMALVANMSVHSLKDA